MEITLALGGGGVRGTAHIGFVDYLLSKGVKINAIAGTSAGGMVGALYAAGFTRVEIERTMKHLDFKRPLRHTKNDAPAFYGISGVAKIFTDLLGNRKIEDLPIKFAATAVNLVSGKEYIIHRGRVVDAILATIAIPGIFPCHQLDEVTLVDGGVLDPIPIALARWLNPNLPVVAVDISQDRPPYDQTDTSLPFDLPGPDVLWENIAQNRYIQAIRIFANAMENSRDKLNALQIAVQKPDVLVHPAVGSTGSLDQVDFPRLLKAGEDAAIEALPQIARLVRFPQPLMRQCNQWLKPFTPPSDWENI